MLAEGLWRIQPLTQQTPQGHRGFPRTWGTQRTFTWLNPVGRREEIHSDITTRDAGTGAISVSISIFPLVFSLGRTGIPTNP